MKKVLTEKPTEGQAKHSFASVEQFIGETAVEAEHVVAHYRKTAFQRFPFIFSLLAIFGSVMTVFGVEHILEQTTFFTDHPLSVLVLGVVILAFTGALYKRLS
jgi:peptide subunit release factor RF-3